MNARPGVVLWVCAGVGANTPNDEFVRVWWALENIGVVPIQAALQLDNRRSPVGHRHGVVVPVLGAGRVPVLNESAILHVVQDVPNEVPLLAHRGRELTTNAFHGTTKQTAVVELVLSQTVLTELMGLSFEDFRKFDDFGFKFSVLLTWNNAHAATLAAAACAASRGSKMCFAKCLTTGTATPSPVR